MLGLIIGLIILLALGYGVWYMYDKKKKDSKTEEDKKNAAAGGGTAKTFSPRGCPACSSGNGGKEGFTTKYTKNNGNVKYRENFYNEYTSNVPVKGATSFITSTGSIPSKNDGFYGSLIEDPDPYAGVM